MLVYFAILRLLPGASAGAPSSASARWAAAAGRAGFGVHPLRVEPIAWATDRGNLLATLLRADRVPRLSRRAVRAAPDSASLAARPPHRARRHRGVAARARLGGDAAARAARDRRPRAAPLRARGDDRERRRRVLREKLPYAAVAAAGFVIALLAKSQSSSLVVSGAIPHGLRERVLQAGCGLAFYRADARAVRSLAAAPARAPARRAGPLDPDRCRRERRDHARRLGAAAARSGAARGVALLRAARLARARLRAGGSADRRRTLQLPRGHPVRGALRRGAAAAAHAARRRPPRPRGGLCRSGSLALACSPPASASVWRDSTALWRRALAVYPDSGLVHFYWGNTLREQGDLVGAIAEYDRALELGVPLAASAHNNRSVAQHARGELALALADMDEAIRLAPSAAAYTNRGLLRLAKDPRRRDRGLRRSDPPRARRARRLPAARDRARARRRRGRRASRPARRPRARGARLAGARRRARPFAAPGLRRRHGDAARHERPVEHVGFEVLAPLARVRHVGLDEQAHVRVVAIDRVHVDHRHPELAAHPARGLVVLLVDRDHLFVRDLVVEGDEVARRLRRRRIVGRGEQPDLRAVRAAELDDPAQVVLVVRQRNRGRPLRLAREALAQRVGVLPTARAHLEREAPHERVERGAQRQILESDREAAVGFTVGAQARRRLGQEVIVPAVAHGDQIGVEVAQLAAQQHQTLVAVVAGNPRVEDLEATRSHAIRK